MGPDASCRAHVFRTSRKRGEVPEMVFKGHVWTIWVSVRGMAFKGDCQRWSSKAIVRN